MALAISRRDSLRSGLKTPGGWKWLISGPIARVRWGLVLGAIAVDGLVAAITVAAATTMQVFLAFVEQVLLPGLRERPGCAVMMDNPVTSALVTLASHKAACSAFREAKSPERAAFEAAGVSYRYLPPYSLDLNPIEPAWAKAKAELRRAEARSLDQLDIELPRALDRITSSAQGWFRHASYRSR